MRTPLANALRQVFGDKSGVVVADYQDSFGILWRNWLEPGDSEISGKSAIVLVGAEPPLKAFSALIPREVEVATDFRQHFTAHSWAAAFRLRNPSSPATILILEVFEETAGAAVADLRKLYSEEHPEKPGLVPGITCLHQVSLAQILRALWQGPTPPLSKGQEAMLRGIIQGHLVPNVEEHHRLGNVVGALVLRPGGDDQDGASRVGRTALGSLLQSLQPATGFDRTADSSSEIDGTLKEIVAGGPPVVLFDDMAELWRPFVQQWIPDAILHVPRVDNDSRKKLTNRLSEVASQPAPKRHLHAADFGALDIANGQPFILLLDLRLFSAKRRADEREFIGDLETLAKKTAIAKDLKWPPISAGEREQVLTAWTDGYEGKPNYRKARSWLPRLISLIDPTLPVVTFSSTQDPEVLKEFAPYGNIVPDFAKPVFRGILGEADEWIGAAHRSFERALRKAWDIGRVQQFTLTASRKAHFAEDAFPFPSKRLANPIVEVFFDESEKNERICVGGVVLIRATNTDGTPHKTDAALWRALSDSNKLFGYCDATPRGFKRPFHWAKKAEELNFADSGQGRQTFADTIEIVERTLGGNGVIFPFALVTTRRRESEWISHKFAPAAIEKAFDVSHRLLIVRCLEALAFCYAPLRAVLESAPSHFAIDLATRNFPCYRDNDLATAFGLRYDFRKDTRKNYRNSLDPEDGWSLAATALFEWSGSWPYGPNVVRARAVTLRPFSSHSTYQGGLLPKQLHHMADWIPHIVLYGQDVLRGTDAVAERIRAFFQRGFIADLADPLAMASRSLIAKRSWDSGRKAEAVMEALGPVMAQSERVVQGIPDIADRLMGSFSEWATELSGLQLRNVFSHCCSI